jgi:hypothetical protein
MIPLLLGSGISRQFVFDGDSRTFGAGATPGISDYPTQTIPLLRAYRSHTMINVGVSGSTGANVNWSNITNKSNTIYVLSTGINGFIAHDSTATVLGIISAGVSAARSAGVFKIIVATCFTSSLVISADETSRAALSTSLLASPAGADGLIYWESDAFLTNNANFPDGTHPNANGYLHCAQVAAPVCNLFL